MSTTPLWLIQNVHLPKREGLWQIAIDKGRFGDITPMGEARSESYEVLERPRRIGHSTVYRTTHPSRYHADGGRTELEPVRNVVRRD